MENRTYFQDRMVDYHTSNLELSIETINAELVEGDLFAANMTYTTLTQSLSSLYKYSKETFYEKRLLVVSTVENILGSLNIEHPLGAHLFRRMERNLKYCGFLITEDVMNGEANPEYVDERYMPVLGEA